VRPRALRPRARAKAIQSYILCAVRCAAVRIYVSDRSHPITHVLNVSGTK
jgi:hypothetical protein